MVLPDRGDTLYREQTTCSCLEVYLISGTHSSQAYLIKVVIRTGLADLTTTFIYTNDNQV